MTIQFPKRRNDPSPIPVAGINAMVAKFSTVPALADLRAAVESAAANYASAVESVQRIAGDKTITEGARVIRQAKIARQKLTDAAAQLEKARTKVAAAVEHYDGQMARPFDMKDARFADVSLHSEIRLHLRTSAERLQAVTAAMQAGDMVTLTAIGAAPAYLSGLPADLHGRVRDMVIGAVAPEALATRATLADGLAAAEQFEQTVMQSTADLVDFDTAAELERSSEAAA